jgi:hypothetical protein
MSQFIYAEGLKNVLNCSQTGRGTTFSVSKVDQQLNCIEESCQEAWKVFVKSKLVSDAEKLEEKLVTAITKIFESWYHCYRNLFFFGTDVVTK